MLHGWWIEAYCVVLYASLLDPRVMRCGGMEFTAKPSGILDCSIKYHNFTHLSSQNFVFLQNKSFIFLTFPDFETQLSPFPVPEAEEAKKHSSSGGWEIPDIFLKKLLDNMFLGMYINSLSDNLCRFLFLFIRYKDYE